MERGKWSVNLHAKNYGNHRHEGYQRWEYIERNSDPITPHVLCLTTPRVSSTHCICIPMEGTAFAVPPNP
jgi:hypothetical protein